MQQLHSVRVHTRSTQISLFHKTVGVIGSHLPKHRPLAWLVRCLAVWVEGFLWELNTNKWLGHCWSRVVHVLRSKTSSLNDRKQFTETAVWKLGTVSGRTGSFKIVFSASFQECMQKPQKNKRLSSMGLINKNHQPAKKTLSHKSN